jgi:hypothetical protein
MMIKIALKTAALVPLAYLGFGTAISYADDCTSGYPVQVSGKISNNGQAGGAFPTLGVVAMKVEGIGKMRCGIVSEDVPTDEGNPLPPGVLAFTHTISCDDEVNVPGTSEIVHSQLTLSTVGSISNVGVCPPNYSLEGPFSFDFQEHSEPKNTAWGMSSGRGIFTGVTEGGIDIVGDASCFGTIDMKFDGHVCMQPTP